MTQQKGLLVRLPRYIALAVLLCVAVGATRAQSPTSMTTESQLQQRLVHQPLYLRGFWMGYVLDFDSAGQPLGKGGDRPEPGPLTLSGIEVDDVAVKGRKLIIHAERIALVADAQGMLQRRALLNTTLMFGTFQKEYRSREMVKISVETGPNGSFDVPLHAIFANGLGELASSAPPAWRCYADAYFAGAPADKEPADMVKECVDETTHASPVRADTAPSMLTQPQPRGTRQAAELHVSGESAVYILIDAHGLPSDFQIVRPVGAGLDEDTLQALSQCRYAPATRNNVPVAAGIHFTMQYR
jgi:TonB family protein